MSLPNQIPLSLYIHFPWCVQKCPYCDFNSHALRRDDLPELIYIDALLNDLDQSILQIGDRSIQSIFMGGGTPSLFSPTALNKLLKGIHKRLTVVPGAEITLEANPGTIEHGRFADYAALGINRISLGAQSFNPAQLKQLGRIHGADEIIQAVDEIHQAGIANFNLDIMHGLPQQTVASAIADLQQAIALEPTHLSWYQLTIEPNTVFYRRPPALPSEGALAEIENVGKQLLSEYGYQQYEISAYAQTDRQSWHNLNYWQFGDYIGIGAGAHSKITDKNGIVRRIHKRKQPSSYLEGASKFVVGTEIIEISAMPLEFMLNALRLNQGFTIEQFIARTGLSIDAIAKPLQTGYQKGLLVQQGDRIKVTGIGRRFLNDTLLLFSADE